MKKDLLQKENVQGFGKGIKCTRGKDTRKNAIVVFVSKKVPEKNLDKDDIVPKKIDGFETDVVEIGEVKPLRTTEHRPAPGGVSIGHYNITAGTLGMTIEDQQGFRFILSNNHVLSDVNKGKFGDLIFQPGPLDGGTKKNTIGTLTRFVPIKMLDDYPEESECPVAKVIKFTFNKFAEALGRKTRMSAYIPNANLVDCALASATDDDFLSDEILEIGLPVGFARAYVGERLKKSGRSSGLTFGKVIAVDAEIKVNFEGKTALFIEQIVTEKMGIPGDSGSVVLNQEDEAVGLLFAGSDSVTIMNKMQNVRAALELL